MAAERIARERDRRNKYWRGGSKVVTSPAEVIVEDASGRLRNWCL